MADRKDRMALLSRYNKYHLQRYEKKANLNLNVEQWAADALVESYGLPVGDIAADRRKPIASPARYQNALSTLNHYDRTSIGDDIVPLHSGVVC